MNDSNRFPFVWCVTVIVCLLGLGATGVRGAERPRRVTATHDTDFVPSTAIVTPHVAFAKPLAAPLRIKALFSVWAPSARQVVELQQRMDMDVEFVAAGRNSKLWRGSSQNTMVGYQAAEDEAARLSELLEKASDVIVIGAVPWAWYPEPLQARMLQQVEAGAGLVITPHKGRSLREEKGPLAALEKQAAAAQASGLGAHTRTVTHGKGRIAFFDLPHEPYYDDHIGAFAGREARDLESFARTLLWAAGRSPALAVEPVVDIGTNRLTVSGSPQGTIAVYRDLVRMYPVLYGALPFELRAYDSLEAVSATRVEDAEGPSRRDYELVAGDYVVLYREYNPAGEVTGWRQREVTVPGAASIASIAVLTADGPVTLDTDSALAWVKPDNPVRLAVRVPAAPEGCQVTVELWDRENRLIAASTGAVQDGSYAATLPLSGVVHDLQVVRAVLSTAADGGGPLAEKRVPLLIDGTHPWQSAHRNRSFGTVLLQPLVTGNQISYFPGYNVDYPRSVIMHAWCDIKAESFLGQEVFLKSDVDANFHRKRSFHDPVHRANQREVVRKLYADTAAPGHPGRVIVVNDEWAWGYVNAPGRERTPEWPASMNQDRSPLALAAFRDYLRQRYQDLEGLNRAWGTAHTDWEQVTPHRFSGTPDVAPPEEVWPALVDHFAFVNHTLSEYLRDVAAVAHEINPRNQVSVSAFYSLGPLTGVDHYRWAQYAPHVSVYYDWGIWQSFTDQPVGRWFGYGESLLDPMNERFRAWKHLFRGMEGASWSREDPFFLPDHTLNPAIEAYYRELSTASRLGLVDLLKAGRSANDVGILYHPRSYFVHALKDWQARPDRWWANMQRRKLYVDYLGRYIEEGLQPWEYRFVDIEQLAQGRYLRHGEPRILIMPLSEALDDRELTVLRRYVERGGVLVGDLNTAARQGSGRLRADGQGALDDVFGITRRAYVEGVTAYRLNEKRTAVPLNFRSQDETQMTIDDVWPTGHAEQGVHEVRLADGTVTRTPITGGTVAAEGAVPQATLPDGTLAFFVNTVGKGNAVYLNYIPWDGGTYARLRAVAGAAGARHTVEEGAVSIIESVREYQWGDQLHLGVLTRINGFGKRWNTNAKQQAYRANLADKTSTLRLAEPAHVYDARRGVYLGHTAAIAVQFSPEWVANLYACLPYEVDGVAVSARRVSAPDGRAALDYQVKVGVSGGKPGAHVLSLTVLNPEGREATTYAARVKAAEGVARGRIHLALNEARGPWTIRVRDAATGVSGETVVQ